MFRLIVEQTSIELLSRSQTFLGVLATIIILFIIANNSNLIREILKEVKEKIAGSVKKLQINTDFSGIIESAEYKLILWYQRAEKKEKDEELENEVSMWTAKVNSKRQELQLRYVDVEVYNPEVLRKIEESKEQLLAPFYSFIFCLVIFLFDEMLMAYSLDYNDFFLTFLSLFIIESYVFWIITWLNFILYMRRDIQMLKKPHKWSPWIQKVIKWKQKIRDWYIGKYIVNKEGKPREYVLMICRTMVILALVTFLLLFNAFVSPIQTIWIISIGVVIPLFVLGFLRLRAYECERKFTYIFLCGHVITLGVLAFLLTLLFLELSQWLNIYDEVVLPYSKMWMKISAFLFVGLNGIVLPLLLPYYCYNKFYHMAEKKVGDSKKDEEREVSAMLDDIKKFASKLPRPGGEIK